MAEEIVLNLKITKGDAEKSLSDITNKIIALKQRNDDLTRSFNKGELSQEEYTKSIQDNNKEMQKLASQQAKNINSLTEMGGVTELATKRLRNMKLEMVAMEEAGKGGTAEYYAMAKAAGSLKDNIGDAQQAINYFSSDTRRLDAAVSGIKGVASAAAIAEGALEALGIQNEDFETALRKMQGLQTMIMGLKETTGLLKEGTLKIAIMSAAQKAYTAIVGTSTGALKAMKLALAGLGIGVIIGLVTLLIAKWDKITALFGKSKTVTEDLAAANDRLQKSYDNLNKKGEEELQLNEALGASKSSLLKDEISFRQKANDQLNRQVNNLYKLYEIEKKKDADSEKTKAAEESYMKAREEWDKNDLALTTMRINLQSELGKEQEAAFNKQKELEAKRTEEIQKAIDLYNLYKEEITKKSISSEKERALSEVTSFKKSEIEKINALKVSNSEKQKLYEELDLVVAKKTEEIDEEYKQKIIDRQLDLQTQLKDLQISGTEERFQYELDQWFKQEEEKNNLIAESEEQRTELLMELESIRQEKLFQHRQELEEQYNQMRDEFIAEREEALAEKTLEKEEEDKEEEIENWYDEQEEAINRLQASEDQKNELRYQLELAHNAKKIKLEKEMTAAKNELAYQDFQNKASYAQQTTANLAEAFGKQTALGKAAAIASATISTFQAAAGAIKGANEAFVPPLSIIMAALGVASALAMGFKQVSSITSIKTPSQTARRGNLVIGPSHEGGGTNVNAEGGEYIVNRTAMSDPNVAKNVILSNAGINVTANADNNTQNQSPIIIQNHISVDDIDDAKAKKENRLAQVAA